MRKRRLSEWRLPKLPLMDVPAHVSFGGRKRNAREPCHINPGLAPDQERDGLHVIGHEAHHPANLLLLLRGLQRTRERVRQAVILAIRPSAAIGPTPPGLR